MRLRSRSLTRERSPARRVTREVSEARSRSYSYSSRSYSGTPRHVRRAVEDSRRSHTPRRNSTNARSRQGQVSPDMRGPDQQQRTCDAVLCENCASVLNPSFVFKTKRKLLGRNWKRKFMKVQKEILDKMKEDRHSNSRSPDRHHIPEPVPAELPKPKPVGQEQEKESSAKQSEVKPDEGVQTALTSMKDSMKDMVDNMAQMIKGQGFQGGNWKGKGKGKGKSHWKHAW